MNLPPPLSIGLGINARPGVKIENCSVASLVKKYGTPIYVYSESRVRDNYRRLYRAFRKYYPNFRILYAMKANNNPVIVKILLSEGAGIDACNPSEIWLAKSLGVHSGNILYTGNYCTDEELKYGLRHCEKINLDDEKLLSKIAIFGKPEILSFRINPGIGRGSTKTNVFAGQQAKFGIPIEKALDAYKRAAAFGVKRFGMHMMTGSCVMEPSYFAEVTGLLLDCAGKISEKLGIKFEFIDIGGGFGIPYLPKEKPLDINKTARLVSDVFIEKCRQHAMGNVQLVVEPGRYFVGDAGILLGTIQMIKESYQRFAGADVTINHLVRPKMYDAYHHIVVANKLNSSKKESINICGSLCDSGDILAKMRSLPTLEEGDILIICNAGAYGFSMSSQYNTRPRAAEILIKGSKSAVVRREEKTEDLFAKCEKAPWL